MSKWRSRTYTYSEPDPESNADSESNAGPNAYSYPVDTGGIDGPDNLYATGNRPDYDAGWTAGYRSGWSTGYEYARRLNVPDLADEQGGEGHPVLL